MVRYFPQYLIGEVWYDFIACGESISFASLGEAQDYLRGVVAAAVRIDMR